MTFIDVVDIILTVLVIAMGAYSAYRSTDKTICSKVSYLITEAAKLDLTGSQKMSEVVDKLYGYVPAVFKKFFTKERLEIIAQSVYDTMKEFAKTENAK